MTLIEELEQVFSTKELKDAVNIPDSKKNLKTIEVFKNAPCNFSNRKLPEKYYSIVTDALYRNGYLPYFYMSCDDYFKRMGSTNVDRKVMDTLISISNENELLFRSPVNKYDHYQNELKRLRLISSNILPNDYKEDIEKIRMSQQRFFTDEELKDAYRKSKIGIVGEYDLFDRIHAVDNKTFLSRDLSNGFGYDIFYTLGEKENYTECLIEVKSTLNTNGDDYFELSENEYNVLLSTIGKSNVVYAVGRVFIDLYQYRNFDYRLLIYNPVNKSFISYDKNGNITDEYLSSEDNERLFKRNVNVLKLKNE